MPNLNRMLEYVEIETCSSCTRKCPWCLYGQVEGFADQPFEILKTSYIEKILYELLENNFKGTVSFYSMNEPLLDERIIDGSLFRICKKILGDAVKIKLNTNADLLTEEILKGMKESGLDFASISCYDMEVLNKVKEYYHKFKGVNCRDYTNENQNKLKYNRAGSIESITDLDNTNFATCHMPYYTTVIGYDGKVRLCAFDSLGQIDIGSIKEQNLFDILNSDRMKKLRKEILNNRMNIAPCNKCNFYNFN
jgi:radical SAM protein with 4Fe4S-binding SPASM domain|nr:radical SAM/SPASM domain-containing protein [uncultured Lachnoclostridium sp.]